MKNSIFILITLVVATLLLSCSPLNPPNSIDINLKFSSGDILVKADDTDEDSLVPELVIEENTPSGGALTFKVNPIGIGTEESPVTYNREETASHIIKALRIIIKNDDDLNGKITLIEPILSAESDDRTIVIIGIADKNGIALKDGDVKYTVEINAFEDSNNKWGIM